MLRSVGGTNFSPAIPDCAGNWKQWARFAKNDREDHTKRWQLIGNLGVRS